MKRTLMVLLLLLNGTTVVISQSPDTMAGRLRDMSGRQVISTTFDNAGKPYIICFWATGNADSYRFLDKMKDLYRPWQEKTGLKLITVAVGGDAGSEKVSPLISGKGWKYENYIDADHEYRKMMNVYDIPHIFVYNGKKELILELSSYQEGDEIAILAALKEGE